MPLTLEHVTYTYPAGTKALRDLSFSVEPGEFVGLMGPTGCGKSTLLQIAAGILTPAEGTVHADGGTGMVFQNPDHQLFETTLEREIAFAPKCQKCSAEETARRVTEALSAVGLDDPALRERSPFTLSGGEKRRAVLAGVLAVEPAILVFDEATAMLDPRGRRTVLRLMTKLCREEGRTVIMITQRPEEAAAVDRVLLMDGGKIIADESPAVIFSDTELIRNAGLRPPFTAKLWNEIRDLVPDPGTDCPLDIRQLTERLCR